MNNDLIKAQGPCWDGYAQRGMKPGDNGKMVPNCVPVSKMDDLWEDSDDVVYEDSLVAKADTYSPPAGVRAAAKKAIRFKEAGKANGAGTSVGWTRAGQLARGESLSLSTVKRMYSYFSRHEVDKKGKDWGSQSNPSNGYIMWLAWGGDAGFSWSRGIVNRMKDKALFAGFGTDYSSHERVTEIALDKADAGINPTQTAQAANSTGTGIKRPEQTTKGGTTGSNIKSKYGKNPKKTRRGRSPDALNSDGAIATTSGTSMGTKADYMECTAESADCNDPMCKVCMNKVWDGSAFGKRDYNTAARERMANSGVAMPDGSFPIATVADLKNAIRLYGQAKNPDKAKAHIKARARALGATDELPDTWK